MQSFQYADAFTGEDEDGQTCAGGQCLTPCLGAVTSFLTRAGRSLLGAFTAASGAWTLGVADDVRPAPAPSADPAVRATPSVPAPGHRSYADVLRVGLEFGSSTDSRAAAALVVVRPLPPAPCSLP
jgi:hypothetical protein